MIEHDETRGWLYMEMEPQVKLFNLYTQSTLRNQKFTVLFKKIKSKKIKELNYILFKQFSTSYTFNKAAIALLVASLY